MRHIRVAVSIALLLIFSNGCTKPLENAIIGKWKEEGQQREMEYFADKTFSFSEGSQPIIGGIWTALSEHRIKLDPKVGGLTAAPFVFENVQVSGDHLTLMAFGKRVTLIREK
jgi:hypothetical protein